MLVAAVGERRGAQGRACARQAGVGPRPPGRRGGGLRGGRPLRAGHDARALGGLVRLGVARRDAGDAVGSASAFEDAFRRYGKDPDALRFLLLALGERGAGAGALGEGVPAGDARRGPARSRASRGARLLARRFRGPVSVLGPADQPRLQGRQPAGRLPAARRRLGPERGGAAGRPRPCRLPRERGPVGRGARADARPLRLRRPARGQRALDRATRGGGPEARRSRVRR